MSSRVSTCRVMSFSLHRFPLVLLRLFLDHAWLREAPVWRFRQFFLAGTGGKNIASIITRVSFKETENLWPIGGFGRLKDLTRLDDLTAISFISPQYPLDFVPCKGAHVLRLTTRSFGCRHLKPEEGSRVKKIHAFSSLAENRTHFV